MRQAANARLGLGIEEDRLFPEPFRRSLDRLAVDSTASRRRRLLARQLRAFFQTLDKDVRGFWRARHARVHRKGKSVVPTPRISITQWSEQDPMTGFLTKKTSYGFGGSVALRPSHLAAILLEGFRTVRDKTQEFVRILDRSF